MSPFVTVSNQSFLTEICFKILPRTNLFIELRFWNCIFTQVYW